MNASIKLVILFGSQARGTAGDQSDADVAILADRPLEMEEKAGVAERFAKHLSISEDKIDIVDLWVAPSLLQHQVAQTGKLLEGDEFDFVRFKVLAWKRYQDTAKFRRIREEVLSKYVQGTHS